MDLKSLFAQPSLKTAAATTSPTAPSRTPTASNAVQEAVRAASEEARVKIAAQAGPSPVEDLEKIAQQVSERDRQGTLKEAHAYGRAICDGFMAQLAVYEKVAAEQVMETMQAADAAAAAEIERVEGLVEKVATNHYLAGVEIAQALLS